ncbi:MAG: response regulator transcription factor [Rhodospirillaceae bacterium]|nr:response regulator transcription factor [Rhodospirillaceae bacterium]
MSAAPHILVVEDDRYMRELVEIYLTGEGYRVSTSVDGAGMRAVMAKDPAQLVIMDLKLPGEDGLTLTRYLRAHYHVGIVILTTRNEAVARVVGLDCGADDYVTKPFNDRELLARIRSVLRRAPGVASGPSASPAPGETNIAPRETLIAFHGYRFDAGAGLVITPGGQEIELTDSESRLLAQLARNPGRVMSRDLLMDLVLQRSRDPLDRSIDVLVTRVRRKLDLDPDQPSLIRTVRGAGYVIPTASQLGETSTSAA